MKQRRCLPAVLFLAALFLAPWLAAEDAEFFKPLRTDSRFAGGKEDFSVDIVWTSAGYFFLTQMMPLELRDIKKSTLLEALPAFTCGRDYVQTEGELRREEALRDLSLTQVRPDLPAHPGRDLEPRLQPDRGRRRTGRRQPSLRPVLQGLLSLAPLSAQPVT